MDPNAPTTVDFLTALYFAIAFVAARFFFDRFIFRRLAIWLLSDGPTPLKFKEAVQAKIGKISESLWKLTYYATVEVFVLSITYQEPWIRDTKEYFRGWPNQELNLSLRLFYMCQCGFRIHSIAALLTRETRRKDFAVMMSHHVITVILIGYSFLTRWTTFGILFTPYGGPLSESGQAIRKDWLAELKPRAFRGTRKLFFRIGSIILALHDASDVLKEAAKVFKYSGKEIRASLSFALFAISWLILRLIFFPFWVIKASSYHVREFVPLSEIYGCSLYYVFNTMLLTLLVFHIYWWVLIYSMIMEQLKNRGKMGEDIRSDSEDDD